MKPAQSILVCWHSERHDYLVLENAIAALRNRRVQINLVLYLTQKQKPPKLPTFQDGVSVEALALDIADPTKHADVYRAVRDVVLPRIKGAEHVHLNVSPGTPAMHAVWLILHAGGAFPSGTTLWSSQLNPETGRTRIDEVTFPITTYLAEVNRHRELNPAIAQYDPQAKSAARRRALEKLARFAQVTGAPLLVLGERGTGKTRLIEAFVANLKRRKLIETVPCGGLDSALAESFLFGHCKGAFTGAISHRDGVLQRADGGILFLDEVQDLPEAAQRKLVRVFQDRLRRFRPLGSDQERSVDVELVCASNLSLPELQEKLDADLFDRLSHLVVEIPPLRECREDLPDDWKRVWHELRRDIAYPVKAPLPRELTDTLEHHRLPGNLRELQRLALLVMAWSKDHDPDAAVKQALDDWRSTAMERPSVEAMFGSGNRKQRLHWFQHNLARWAKSQFGTWTAAANVLECDEKTLRQDASDTVG